MEVTYDPNLKQIKQKMYKLVEIALQIWDFVLP